LEHRTSVADSPSAASVDQETTSKSLREAEFDIALTIQVAGEAMIHQT
jgi:hypothetical protein